MTSLARAERQRLSETARRLGGHAPTLSGDWTVKDLVAHLVLREGSPAAAGLVVPGLGALTDLRMRRLARHDFTVLLERFRTGPPFYSPLALPPVDRWLNMLELFVHHEDIRRAQPDWTPRPLGGREQDALWRAVSVFGRVLVRRAPCGVVLARSDRDETTEGATVRLKSGGSSVTVRGLPSEITLHLYGREDHAEASVHGDPTTVAAFGQHDLGL